VTFNGGASWVTADAPVYSGASSSWSATGSVSDLVGVRISDASHNLANTVIDGRDYGQEIIQFGSANGNTYNPTNNQIIYAGSGDDTFAMSTSMLNGSSYHGILSGGGGTDDLQLTFDDQASKYLDDLVYPDGLRMSGFETMHLSGFGGTLTIGDPGTVAAFTGSANGSLTIYTSQTNVEVDGGYWNTQSDYNGTAVYQDSSGQLTLTVVLVGA
jgi:hypothetical protein